MIITPGQCGNARAMLGLERSALAVMTHTSRWLIAAFESGECRLGIGRLRAIRAALEAAGAIFIEENGEGPGVRLRNAENVITTDITPAQMFAARQLLRWSRIALASRISASFDSVRLFEVEGKLSLGFNPGKARAVLEAAGVEFIAENAGGAGVRFIKPLLLGN